MGLVPLLAHAADEEHLVVHREPEDHGEDEDRDPAFDLVEADEPDRAGAAPLEEQDEQPILEEWDDGHTNEEAVSAGLAKTGRIVTAAGLVMFAAFMGFVAGSIVGLQQFGFGLAAAILIDVTIVRALLVPSAMKLFGRWNWWLPTNVARIFRVKPSPLRRPDPHPAASSGR